MLLCQIVKACETNNFADTEIFEFEDSNSDECFGD